MKIFFSQKSFQQAVLKALPPLVQSGYILPSNSSTIYPDWATRDYTNAFISSTDIYSIVSYISDQLAAVPVYAYGKDAKGKRIVLPETDPLNQLITTPNKYLSTREFFWLTSVLYLISGEVFIYLYKTGAERGGKVLSMQIFTAQDTAIQITGTFPYEINSFIFTYSGREVLKSVPPEDVIHIKMPSIVYDYLGSHLRGMSPLRPGRRTMEGLDMGEQRAISVLKNGGVPGLIYLESQGGNEVDKDAYDKWRRVYQEFIDNIDNKGAPMPMAGKAGYIQTGLSAIDMQLKESQDLNFKKACNLYHVSDLLFNTANRGTFNNLKEMRQAMYTDAIMPVSDAISDALNRGLIPDKKKEIAFDFSEIAVLQDDMLTKMNAISAAPTGFTGNQILEMWGYERSEEPNMDRILIKQGYGFIDESFELPEVNDNL